MTPLKVVCVQERTRRGRRDFSMTIMMTPVSMRSLDLSGDQEVVINPGFMESKLFKFKIL